jgi:hypothetical protein
MRVFENRVLRRTFGTKRDKVTRVWRKLRNEELHNLDVSLNIMKIIKTRWIMMGNDRSMRGGKKRRVFNMIWLGKPE